MLNPAEHSLAFWDEKILLVVFCENWSWGIFRRYAGACKARKRITERFFVEGVLVCVNRRCNESRKHRPCGLYLLPKCSLLAQIIPIANVFPAWITPRSVFSLTLCLQRYHAIWFLSPCILENQLWKSWVALQAGSRTVVWNLSGISRRIRVSRSAVERFLDKRCFMFLVLQRKLSDNFSTHGTV